MAKGNHSFTEQEIRKRFGAIIGHTVAEVDTAGVLTASAASRNKGRIGAVIEQSVLGYPADSDRRPDIVIDGFPCQDYSVARPLNQAHGIEGKKGVLWWDIYHFLEMKKPRFGLFENVDRLLKSPASQRGRDFAIILSCLADLGYTVEWRVVNSAEYGFPQRRKRVYIFCEKDAGDIDLTERMRCGVMAKAFPAVYPDEMAELDVLPDPYENSTRFGVGQKVSQFKNAGVMQGFHVLTCDFAEDYRGERLVLGDVLIDELGQTPDEFDQIIYKLFAAEC